MSLRDDGSVDLILNLPNSNRTALIVYDNDQIMDERKRDELLARKLSGYWNYVASGAFIKKHPRAAGRELVIEVICTYPPTPRMGDIMRVRHDSMPSVVLPVTVSSVEAFYERLGIPFDGAAGLEGIQKPS